MKSKLFFIILIIFFISLPLSAQTISGGVQEVDGRFYNIGKKIHQGKQGAAYAAQDLITGDQVVVKALIDERYRNHARREIKQYQYLQNHCHDYSPYWTRMLAADPEGAFIILEKAASSLAKRLEINGPMKESEAKLVLRQVLEGLKDLHNAGIVHRDFKTVNILVFQDDQGIPAYKLADLGDSELMANLGERNATKERLNDILYIGYLIYEVMGLGSGMPELRSPGQFKDLMLRLSPEFISKNPNLTVEEILNHPWFR